MLVQYNRALKFGITYPPGELKGGKVSGFHNWIAFANEEQDADLDYQGYMNSVDLGNKVFVLLSNVSYQYYSFFNSGQYTIVQTH